MERYSDYQLIQDYLKNSNQKAFKALLDRYFDHTKKVLFNGGMPAQDVGDACQQVWVKIVRALPGYKDEGKFGALITTAAKNLCKDYWRARKYSGLHSSMNDDEQNMDHDLAFSTMQNTENNYQNSEAISLLTAKLIPELGSELRTVFLLKHEAEYWDDKRPLSWSDLSMLFGVSREQIVEYFVNARDGLVEAYHEQEEVKPVSNEELGVFLVWTQSQRKDKKQKQTESRLASLIGIPVNTFKTRYKRAREALAEELNAYRS